MNILFFNRSFYPDVEATGQFLTELCEDLTDKGHAVTVVAGRSYHLNNGSNAFLIKREKYKSINIVRAIGTTLPKQFLLFRLINLGTYFLSAFVSGFLVKHKVDIVITQTDPPVSGLLGIFFSKWYKAKFVYYCQDIFPDVGIITGELTNPTLNFLLKKVNLISFKKADKIICIGESMGKRIIGKKINADKIAVIHNWADIKNLYPVKKEDNEFIHSHNLLNKFVVMYSGNVGLTQNLEKLIAVANYFRNREDIKFLIVGEGARKASLQKLVVKLNLLNVEFLPYQFKEELRYSLSSADIHLIPFKKGLTGVMVPSKIYSILACGRPFIAWVDSDSEISKIAERFKCGIIVPPDEIEDIIKGVEWAVNHHNELSQMGENGRNAVIKYFDRKISTDKFNKVLNEII